MKMKNITGIYILILYLTTFFDYCVAEEARQAIARPASAGAQVVLDYLNSIQGEKMVAGHHVMYGRRKDQDLKYIVDTTGRFPGLDYLDVIGVDIYRQGVAGQPKKL